MKRVVDRFFLAALFAISFVVTSCVSHGNKDTLQRFEFQKTEMAVPFRIVLYAPDEMKANVAVAAAFKRIEQINDIMSDYDPDSELSQLSRTAGKGKAVHVSDDLWTVLKKSQELSAASDGAFDITVGPCIQLWRQARREKKLPDAEKLSTTRAAIGWQKLKLHDHTAELLVPNMKLDLGAIAKGYADDQALKVLREQGITRALVTGGGDMAAGDPPPGKKGWRIELAPLDAPDAPPTNFVLLANAGLATSGDLFQRVEIDGKRYSHIVDPRTGIGLTDHSLVIVIAPNGFTADGLSTTISVLGPERGVEVAKKYRAVTRIARKPDTKVEVIESAGFKKRYDTH